MSWWRSPQSVLARSAAAALTYAEVRATAGELPAGYRHVARRYPVGAGSACFERAAAAVLGWEMHRGAGLRVHPGAGAAADGVEVVLQLGPRPVAVLAPCRVVYVVGQDRRCGFAYGTLPGHPESGEEAFVVEHRPDGGVELRITAFSRPSTWYARLGGPVGRAVQDRVTDRYASALRRLAADAAARDA